MNELIKAKEKLILLKESYEEKCGRVKNGYNYRWNQVFRDICVIENAIEILQLIEK